MKPGGVVSLKKINYFSNLFKNKLLILMCFSLILGIIVGSISVSLSDKTNGFFEGIFNYYVKQRMDTGFLTVFFTSFVSYIFLEILFFIFGTSIVGVVLSPILCCVIGIYFSGISAFAYNSFLLKGVAFNAIVIIPTALSVVICAFYAAKVAFSFSAVIIKLTLPKNRISNISGDFKAYCGKFIIILILFLSAALIDAVVSISFLKFFSF